MTSYAETVHNKRTFNVDIALGDDSIISANIKGVRKVNWQNDDRPVTVPLTNTLIAPDKALGLLYIPKLTKKHIPVLFLQEKSILFDINDKKSVLGHAKQGFDE